jgi:hypothetical protein
MTAEEQAVVLVNEVRAERGQELWKSVGDRRGYGIVLEALCRAIEQHEAFRQEHGRGMVGMTHEEDTLIRKAARSICAEQAKKQDNDDWAKYLLGDWDHTLWVRLTEQGIRKGIEIGRSL